MLKIILSFLISFSLSTLSFAEAWMGSGFFISPSGYIATAGHVAIPAKHLKVLYKGKYYVATFIAGNKGEDSAIIKIDVEPDYFYAVNMHVYPGERLYLIGYPAPDVFGYSLHYTQGYIRYLDGEINMNLFSCEGNSGSPVLNTNNDAVGILVSGTSIGSICSYITQARYIMYIVALAQQYNILLVNGGSVDGSYTLDQAKDVAIAKDSVVMIFGED